MTVVKLETPNESPLAENAMRPRIVEMPPKQKRRVTPLLMNQQQAAERLGCCQERFRELSIPCVKLPNSNAKYWRMEDLENYVNDLETQ